MRITEDLVLGARFRYTKSGGRLLRLFDVTGLTPGKDTLAAAASAVDPASGARIPRYGEPHPAVAGLYAIDIDAEPAPGAPTTAPVNVLYGSPDLAAGPGAGQIVSRLSNR